MLDPKTSLPHLHADERERLQLQSRVQLLERDHAELASAYAQLRELLRELVENLDVRQLITLRILMDVVAGKPEIEPGTLTRIDLNAYRTQFYWVQAVVAAMEWYKRTEMEVSSASPPEEEHMIEFGG